MTILGPHGARPTGQGRRYASGTHHEWTKVTGQREDPFAPCADLTAKIYSGLVNEGTLSPPPSCDSGRVGGGERRKRTDRWAV